MNKIHFNTLTIKNFFSIGAEIEVDFNTYSGMNYVFGFNKDLNVKNGSGKSTIFIEAILFCLFNKTSKGVNKGHIPHRLVGKECVVKMNFNIDDDNYTIENSIHHTYVKLTKHNSDGSEENLTKSSIKETYDYIEKEILKSTFLMFRNSLVLSINDNRNIFKMSKWEKRQFTEQMMNLSHIGRMYNKSKETLNNLDKELTLKRQSANALSKDIKEFKSKSESFNLDKKTRLSGIKSELEVIEMQINSMDTDDSDIKDRQKQLLETKTLLKEKLEKLNGGISDLTQKLLTYKTELKSFESTKKKYAKVLDIICEDCADKADEVLGLATIKDNLDDMVEKITFLTSQKGRLSDAHKEISAKVKQIETELKSTEKEIDKISRNRQELQYLSKEFTDKSKHLDEIVAEISPFEDLIVKYQDELNVVNENISEMCDKRKYLDFLVHMTSEDGVRKHLLLDYVNMLNTRIRKYLEEMGCEYTAVFDGNFSCEFITTTGICEYHNFSAGEKVRIDSACMFAFRDLLFGQGTLQSNIFVCDEILDASLDEYAIQSVVKILKEIAKTQTVFVISHRECVSPEDFNNIIVVKKQNGYTTIADEEDVEDVG